MQELSLLLVEDQTVLREGLRQLIESEPGLRVAGEAGTVQEGIAQAKRLQPDVILLDLKLPDGSGLEVARQVLADRDPPAVVVLSTYEDVALVKSALDLGASGFIPKSASFAEIVSAVRAAAAGGVVLHPSLAIKVAKRSGHEDLNQDEMAILRLLAEGLAYAEIGSKVFLSERTVRRHMNVILAKLGAQSRAQAVAEAMRRGLLD
jgi:DNA-binding NarL/FixJ family response regulator